jgi:hypothetical protein
VNVAAISGVPTYSRGAFLRPRKCEQTHIAHDGACERRGRRTVPPVVGYHGTKVVRPYEAALTGTSVSTVVLIVWLTEFSKKGVESVVHEDGRSNSVRPSTHSGCIPMVCIPPTLCLRLIRVFAFPCSWHEQTTLLDVLQEASPLTCASWQPPPLPWLPYHPQWCPQLTERAIPALLLPYVDGPIPGGNFLSDYCRFCWDIRGYSVEVHGSSGQVCELERASGYPHDTTGSDFGVCALASASRPGDATHQAAVPSRTHSGGGV